MDEETNESRASRIASNVEPVDAREEVANAGNHYLVARPAVPVPEDELSPEEERRRSRVGNGTAADARRNVDRGRTANVHGERKGLTRDEAQALGRTAAAASRDAEGETNADGGRRRRRLSPSSNVGFNWRPSKPPSRRRRRRGPSSSDTSAPGFDPRPRRAPFRSRSPYPWTRERRLRTRGIITSSRDRRCPCRRMNSRRRRNGGARASGTESPRTRDETSTEDGPRTRTRQPPPRRDARGRRCPRDTSASTTWFEGNTRARRATSRKDRRLSKTSTRSRTRTILRRTPRATSTSTISRGRRVWRRKRRRRARSRRWRRRDRGRFAAFGRRARVGIDQTPEDDIRARPGEKGRHARRGRRSGRAPAATDAGVAAGLHESSGDSRINPRRKTSTASHRREDPRRRPGQTSANRRRRDRRRRFTRWTQTRARRGGERLARGCSWAVRRGGRVPNGGRRDRDGEIRVGGCHPGLEVRLSRLARRLAERGAIVSGCRLGCHLGCRLGCHLARRRVACPPRGRGGGVGVCAPPTRKGLTSTGLTPTEVVRARRWGRDGGDVLDERAGTDSARRGVARRVGRFARGRRGRRRRGRRHGGGRREDHRARQGAAQRTRRVVQKQTRNGTRRKTRGGARGRGRGG